ncbi:Envelope glycoprotein gp160 [Exophiala xenobiotica]|nr:Envelope glycoprotein gp160 [Exophiala xenobiotica]
MSNSTSFDPANCTYTTCSVTEYGQLTYIPSLPGNAFYLAMFAAAAIAQLALGITYRTWSFTIGMLCGCALEILGYVARIQLHYNDFDNNHFIVYLVGLTIAPAFFSGSIYLCLARIIAVYGTGVSVLSPRAITVVFVCSDFFSLVLQAAGGALASLALSKSMLQAGINTMIAGLALQVASTTVFCVVCLQIVARVFMRPGSFRRDTVGLAVRETGRFRYFLWGIAIATIAILVRCSFRVAELSKGFGSALANNQVLFMVLDGAMMSVAVLVLTGGHPGLALGREMWREGGITLCGNKSRKARRIRVDSEPRATELRATMRK